MAKIVLTGDRCIRPMVICWDFFQCSISYPLFADAGTGIYPHAASQYHARPKAKCGIVMLSVDKSTYPCQQTKDNEFIPCSNDVYHVSAALKLQLSPLFCQNHRINDRISAARKVVGDRDCHCDVINDVPFPLYVVLMTSNVRYVSLLHGY